MGGDHLLFLVIGAVSGALGALSFALIFWRPLAMRSRRLEGDVAVLTEERERLLAEHAAARIRAERSTSLEEELKIARSDLATSRVELERLRTAGEIAKANHEERTAELLRMRADLAEKFDALAVSALGKNSDLFLGMVSERFNQHKQTAEQDLALRQTAIESLVKPLAENLGKLQGLSDEIEKQRVGAYSAVVAQLQALSDTQAGLRTETGRLVNALRRPQTRGRWGEYQLRNVLEMAGMTEHADFVTQQTVEGEEGRLRPDAVVRLPGGKFVVVDAKTPLDAYLNAIEAEDEFSRDQALARHAKQVEVHLRSLSAKEYWRALSPSPDFVVMFVPGEPMYAAAVERVPTLFEEGLRANVLIVTPVTFVALVKAIAYGWQQEKLAANSQQLASMGRELYERISSFGDHLRGLGLSLTKAVDRFNNSVGTLEARVLPAARRFEQTGALPATSAIDAVNVVNREVRELHASEFAPDAIPRVSNPLADGSAQ